MLQPRQFAKARHAVFLCAFAPSLLLPVAAQGASEEFTWHSLSLLNVEGKGWAATKQLYDRLPAKAQSVVRAEVWDLSHDSAGLRYRFVTDATVLRGRWKLRRENQLALPHMPATGVSGLDLYIRDGERWRGAPNSPTSSSRIDASIGSPPAPPNSRGHM